MRFERLDLNLLVALDALLAEKSVSLAAERICLSQSATSSALGRLRDYFGDDLLVVKGRQMVLTARGEQLIEPVAAVLDQIRSTIAVTPPFDPASSDRLIRIMASDYVTEVALARTLNDIQREAPHMRFEVQQIDGQLVEALERGLVDILITIDYAMSADHPSQILFQDDHVVVGWDKNPVMHEDMTRDLYFAQPHVITRFGRGRVSAFEDWFMRRQKKARRVEIVAPTFVSVPSFIVGTNRIATMHRRMATRMANVLPLIVKEVPMDIPPIREAIQWHLSNNNDPAIRWIVDRLCAGAAEEDRQLAQVPSAPIEHDRDHAEISAQFQNDSNNSIAPR